MIRAFASRQFVLFLLTGGTAAAVNFASRIFYGRWLDYSTSIIVAYLTGMVTAFVLARLFVFTESSQGWHRSALIFTLVNILAVVQTWAISMGLAYHVLPSIGVTRFSREIAHAVGIAFPVFTSYLGHKHWSFR
ncbi:GtrA family protein [Accumulibacter sp.]|uniref:GtrA family protein n=1 Tax=Accumulibacter sp. TaxID=2053492 RepID=UPI0028C3C0E4|nr:GtrA family protein [Accumulibacter sp.]